MAELFKSFEELSEDLCKNVQKAAAKYGYCIECQSDEKEEPLLKINCPHCEQIKKVANRFGFYIDC